jgi:hypothetical protein
MITIKKSPTADTRTCDWSKVTKEQLIESSQQHIHDVGKGLSHFAFLLMRAAGQHDHDKISGIDQFHDDFKTGFEQTHWWDNHRKVNRHHINMDDGVPEDVNLIDVIEHIVDCVMAGMARRGNVFDIQLANKLLQKAVNNTTELLKENVTVEA